LCTFRQRAGYRLFAAEEGFDIGVDDSRTVDGVSDTNENPKFRWISAFVGILASLTDDNITVAQEADFKAVFSI
jgi:hypothetical protein